MPRVARIIAPQYPHHITQRGNNRADVFFDDEDRTTYLSLLKSYCEKWTVEYLGILPDDQPFAYTGRSCGRGVVVSVHRQDKSSLYACLLYTSPSPRD